jgi:NB-ARC domain/WD domain, G-beta repeat/TIR domain
VWTTEIEVALDTAEFVLALLTSGSYASEICRAEQLRSLRKGKCVIPVLDQKNADIPLHLEAKNYRDFTTSNSYAKAFNELLGDLHVRNGIELKKEFRQTYVTAPPLPVNYVERPQALAALRNSLITADGGYQIALTALQGMGGIGKTVLAQALCHDEVVQQAFPDGVIWVTVGKESTVDVVTRMREVGQQLGDDLARYDNETGCTNQYRSTIRSKAALIVIDDVWRASDLEPLRAEGSPRSRLLFTTRDASIAAAVGGHEHVADLLTEEQSRDVLARWSGTEVAKLLLIADDLIRECGRLPLALSMVGAMLRGKPQGMWKRVHELLRNADLEKIKVQFPDYPYTDVLRALQVSVDVLDATARERYLALAVLLEDMAAAPLVQQCLWRVDEGEALQTAEQFVSLSLALRGRAEGSTQLHDLQLGYARARYAHREALALIHGAVRLSAHVIEKDPRQFASQVLGRLLPHRDAPAIQQFIDEIAAGAPVPWLRPLQAALQPPGTGLLRALEGHSDFVNGVAVSGDGRRAVSACADGTLKLWDVESGLELRTMEGHSSIVNGVAVSGDGRWAASASADNTVKVWDVEGGVPLITFTCDAPALCCAFINDRKLIAGDAGGRVHFLRLEKPKAKG